MGTKESRVGEKDVRADKQVRTIRSDKVGWDGMGEKRRKEEGKRSKERGREGGREGNVAIGLSCESSSRKERREAIDEKIGMRIKE